MGDEVMEYDYIEQGDCLELMKTIPDESIDMILTDPPYGISFQSNFRKNKFEKLKNDDVILSEFVTEAKRIIKPTGAIYCFTRWDVFPTWSDVFYSNDLKIKNTIVWFKKGGGLGDLKKGYIYNHEFIIYCPMQNHKLRGKRRNDVFEFKKVPANKYLHPTQKPVDLLQEMILKSTDENDVVLDPFMGSGSTCVACVNTNRHYIGFELEEKYFNIACKRLDEAEHDLL